MNFLDHTSAWFLCPGGNVVLHHHLHTPVQLEIEIYGRDRKKLNDACTSFLDLHVMFSSPYHSQ
jgi:hypothetical protein